MIASPCHLVTPSPFPIPCNPRATFNVDSQRHISVGSVFLPDPHPYATLPQEFVMASAAPPTTRTPMAEVQQILCPNCHKPNLRRAKFCQHCAHDMVLNNDGPRYYITRVIKSGGQ